MASVKFRDAKTVEVKTKPGLADVGAFIGAIDDVEKRSDAEVLIAMMKKISGEEPVMWGSSIIGFGRYTYTYASGKTGEWMITGFSPRKSAISIYIMPGFSQYGELLAELGKYKTGKSCLYVKRLEEIDMNVLRTLVAHSYRFMQDKYSA
ncbi:DUF1801 domain-containing protein [Hoeflea prorocentri]|uniref:DUF1801 domain-containing protein n=1 Tax=Hoeflea prorocentri TaxID=1922333 RepID=A0A9X3UJA9_9HYPH|nr:DUF1801 domain-containing protein [Hoeflea prorocentri]MCY6381667.1 DUF1801 domain-containing protein [Hoeflea prorocentri]MDA5399467.1 DUF1801 domain-containing protein [Hoeflea prorocentri]